MSPTPNPFAQLPHYWNVRFSLSAAGAGTAEESFSDIALSVSGFETDEANHLWTFDLLFATPPDMAEIARRLMVIAGLHGLTVPQAELIKLEQKDWLAEVARDFPPLIIDRFFVHGAHVTDVAPRGSIPIQVEAGAAFGSGEHGTTRGCLEALAGIARRRSAQRILDMGCGSGILAIAAAKLWRTHVLAVDIDEVAVRVTAENARINRVAHWVEALAADGYAVSAVKRGGPYDVIVSNILAKPLVAFAPQLAAHLAPNGVAVLSGLLADQEPMVRSAHAMQGLRLRKRFIHSGWCTLVLSR